MWLSLADGPAIPQSVRPDGAVEIGLQTTPSDDIQRGETASFAIWVQPGKDATGHVKQVQNITFTLTASNTLVDILDTIRFDNPAYRNQPNGPYRFTNVVDSTTFDPLNTGAKYHVTTQIPDALKANGSAFDDAKNAQGWNLALLDPQHPELVTGLGIGGAPWAGDPTYQSTSLGDAWRLATFSIRSLDSVGNASLHLGLGDLGATYFVDVEAEHAAGRSITIGPDGVAFGPDAVIHLLDHRGGDFDRSGIVDGADLLKWQRQLGASQGGAASADDTWDGHVDLADLAIWKQGFGGRSLDFPLASGTTMRDVLKADYSTNGVVDGADLLAWQRALGADPRDPTVKYADGNGDGVVNGADLAFWKTRFSQATLSETVLAVAVPEPAALASALMDAIFAIGIRRCYRKRIALSPSTLTSVEIVKFGCCCNSSAPQTESLASDDAPDGSFDGGGFLAWQRANGTNCLVVDGNTDGTIDRADFLKWQRELGSTSKLLNRDPRLTGPVSAGDLSVWKGNLGNSPGLCGTTLVGDAADVVFHVGDVLAGDYNGDLAVDGADKLLCQRRLGSSAAPAGSSADGNRIGLVDAGDLDEWRRNLRRSNQSAMTFAVPEPGTGAFMVAILSFPAARCRGSQIASVIRSKRIVAERDVCSALKTCLPCAAAVFVRRQNKTRRSHRSTMTKTVGTMKRQRLAVRSALIISCAMALFTPPCTAVGQLIYDGWRGGSNDHSWNDTSNWSLGGQGWVPGTAGHQDNVVVKFDASNPSSQVVNLDDNRIIEALNITTSSSVTIRSNAGQNYLLQLKNGAPQSSGILKESGSGSATISADVRIRNDQTWTNDGALLTVSGNLSAVNSGRSLTIAGDGNVLLSGSIGIEAGGLTKNGGGTLTLADPPGSTSVNANTFTGKTVINGGTVILSKNSGGATDGFGAAVGNLDIYNNNTLVQLTKTWQIRDDATVNVNSGRLDVGSGVQELIRTLNLNSGTLSGSGEWFAAGVIGNSINATAGSSTISASRLNLGVQTPINVAAGSQLTIQSEIHDYNLGGFVKNGPGTLVLSGATANTYSDATYVFGGTLVLAKAHSNYQAAITGNVFVNGGTLRLGEQGQLGDGFIQIVNSTFDMASYDDTVGELIMDGGTITGTTGSHLGRLGTDTTRRITSDGSSVIQSETMFANGNVPINVQSGTLTINSRIENYVSNGAITKDGPGKLLLNGAALYSGATTVNGGVLQGSTNTIGGSNIHMWNGAAVSYDQNFEGTVGVPITGLGFINVSGGGKVNLTNTNNSFDGGVNVAFSRLGANGRTLGVGRLTLNGSELNLSSGDTVSNLITLGPADSGIHANGQVAVVSGQIDGQGHLAVYGGGIIQLTNSSNTFSGGLAVLNSFVEGSAQSLGSGPISLDGGWLLAKGATPFGNSVSLSAIGAISTEETVTISGNVSGSGSLYKYGSGSVILGGTNSHLGNTVVNAGTLILGSPTFSGGAGDTRVNAGATLRYGNHHQIKDAASVIVDGGTIDYQGWTDAYNSLVLVGGIVTGGVGSSLGIASPGITSDGTSSISTATYVPLAGNQFNVQSGTLSVSSSIIDGSGPSTFVKNGVGTLTLNGGAVNAFSGGTVVNQGTLILDRITDGATQAANDGGVAVGNLTVNAGATARVNQFHQIKDSATVMLNSGTLEINGPAIEGVKNVVLANGFVHGTGGLAITHGGTISSSGDSVIGPRVIPQLADNNFQIDVASGKLSLTSGIEGSTPGQVLTKKGAGELELKGTAWHNSTTIEAGKFSVNTVAGSTHTGSITVGPGGTLGGTGVIGGSVTGPGRVAPGNSPGILTINGSYTMQSASQLDIEINGTGTAGVDYDLLRVGGQLTLRGAINLDFANNPAPTLGDSVTFIETFGAGEVLSVPVGSEPRINTTGLSPASNLAARVTSNVGPGGSVEVELVQASDTLFDGTAASTNWYVGGDWSTAGAMGVPGPANNTFVGGNVFVQTGVAQRVVLDATISPEVAQVRQLVVGDALQPVILEVQTGLNSVTGDISIVENGAVELRGGNLFVGAAQTVRVSKTGMLSGNGTVNGSLKVGEAAGLSGAMLSPGVGTGFQIGTLDIKGNVDQGVSGVYRVDVATMAGGIQADMIRASGAATFHGTLEVDVSHLASPSAGTTFTIANAASINADAFANEAVGDKIELVQPIGSLATQKWLSVSVEPHASVLPNGALASSSVTTYDLKGRLVDCGDAFGDGTIDERDTKVLAALLVNKKIPAFNVKINQSDAGMYPITDFKSAFDLYPRHESPDGVTLGDELITFDDAVEYAKLFAASQNTTFAAAMIKVNREFQLALRSVTVPEPSSGALAVLSMIAWHRRRGQGRSSQ
jgi:autotransporter-associated beta strand protein